MANRKILVGIDYGTTTTRVTYALWDPRDPWHRDVRLLDFAGAGGIPSTINNGQGGSCTWTKILLDANYQHPGYQSRVLRELQASGYLSVPNPHSCQTVIKEFLRVLLNKIKLFLRNVTDFDRLPVDYWFSIPGVYSGVAKSQMLKAIQTAGYTGRPQDNVYFLSEGEAAAVAVQHRLSGDKLQPGTPFLVVDCGGGTTDVTTLEITDATGVARSFTNLGATVGLHAGGTQVDCEFVLVLENELNAVPERMWDLATLRGIMGQIERLKFHFLGRQSGTLHLPKRPQLLDAATMERTVDKVVGRISWRVVRTACQDPRIKTVILVGGFGQCPRLQNKLRWDLQEVGRSLIVMQPYQHQLVSHGATLFGLELAHRRSGLSLKSYGVVSVVSVVPPGYGNTGEASRVPCWVIRTNDNFQESGQGWLDILLLYDGHGTTVKTIPLIESNSVIAPTRIDDSELFAPGTRWFGTKGSIWQRVDYESGVREVHSICCNLENLSLQNSTVPRQPLPGAGGPVFLLTATVHWQFINNPSRIKFTATILGVCVGEKEIHINY